MSVLFGLPVHLRQQVQLPDIASLPGCPMSQSSQSQAALLRLMGATFGLLHAFLPQKLCNPTCCISSRCSQRASSNLLCNNSLRPDDILLSISSSVEHEPTHR